MGERRELSPFVRFVPPRRRQRRRTVEVRRGFLGGKLTASCSRPRTKAKTAATHRKRSLYQGLKSESGIRQQRRILCYSLRSWQRLLLLLTTATAKGLFGLGLPFLFSPLCDHPPSIALELVEGERLSE